MKTIATVLLVLAAIIGMATPVLGAEAGSSAGAYADWDIATQYSSAWADNGWESAEAGSIGWAEGYTASDSGASATDIAAEAGTGGACTTEYGGSCYTGSGAEAQEWDSDGWTNAVAGSSADGAYVETDGSAASYWGPPIWSGAGAYGYVIDGEASSGAGSIASLI